MTTQPEPDQRWPHDPGDSPGPSGDGDSPGPCGDGDSAAELVPGGPAVAVRPARPWRRRGRLAAVGALLMAGVIGLGVSAVGIAHQLLPRQFTVPQQRAIAAWEVQRRWRADPAGKIFPATVQYSLSAGQLNASRGLMLRARLLGISPATSCARAISGTALQVLRRYGCSDALRATYVDASGSLVATLAVAVLPSSAVARAAVSRLSADGAARQPSLVRTLTIARTPAAGFGAAQGQLSWAAAAQSYVIMATAGFADGRRFVHIAADSYQDSEMTSLAEGLMGSAASVLGSRPAVPVCPRAPGC